MNTQTVWSLRPQRASSTADPSWPRCATLAVPRGVPMPARARARHASAAGSTALAASGGGGAGSGGGGGGGSSGPSFGGRRARPENRRGKARQPGLFEIKVVAPPPRSLGVYALPPLTHCGEEIEVDGQSYIVTALNIQFKLVKGKYQRAHHRLDVQPTGRHLLNMMLDDLMSAKYVGPVDTGAQD